MNISKLLIGISIFIFTIGIFYSPKTFSTEKAPGRIMADMATKHRRVERYWRQTVDHSKLPILNKDFHSGEEITRACLSCHTEAASQIMMTIHWNWLKDPKLGLYGKAGYSFNNYCISTNKMHDKGCSKCHIAWDKLGKKGTINCIRCHGQSEDPSFTEIDQLLVDYKEFANSENPDDRELAKDIQNDIRKVIQSVGRPRRKNCGKCHFYSGGGDGVKHGDLDSSLFAPEKALDVHMSPNGQNFQCVRCHTTILHNIAGRVYTMPAASERKSLVEFDLTTKITCESCHTARPHKKDDKMNDHTDRVACQSCHIPKFARKLPTKVQWDWSKAGKLKDGKPYTIEGPYGKHIYKSEKGEFKWAKNVIPEYFWYNGSIKSRLIKDPIEDPNKVLWVSWPVGDPKDKKSRIHPFKIHRSNQPYDTKTKLILAPLLTGKQGYWTTWDLNNSFKLGMEYLGLPYSGKYSYIKSNYVYPITHMVAPKDQALSCEECHSRNGRLKNIRGIYIPGRDRNKILEVIGWIMVIGAFFGVSTHGLARIISRKNNKMRQNNDHN